MDQAARPAAIRKHAQLSRNESSGNSLPRMDHRFLCIICAGVLLLVTAFALATPGLKNDPLPERSLVMRIALR
jgi:hypothetical protein